VREVVNKVLVILFLLLVTACGDIGTLIGDLAGGDVGGSGQCGGAGETGGCIRIESIVPEFDGKNTSNVDSVQDTCNLFEMRTATTPIAPKYEVYKDHSAKLTISNRPLPGVQPTDISDVTLEKYAITYRVNRCPAGGNCPPISELFVAPGETMVIPSNGSITVILPLVPIATRMAYVGLGGTDSHKPSYTATYSFTGTDSFRHPVSVVGSTEFTIGNYDRCAEG